MHPVVCCNHKEHNEKVAIYYYGNRSSDVTGIIAFDRDGGGFEIIKEPDDGEVHLRSINKVYSKYWKCFARGEFKEKISYEY